MRRTLLEYLLENGASIRGNNLPALACQLDRLRVLCCAVLYQGCALPVAWAVQAADQKGSWNDIWAGLLGRLRAALGPGWQVLVLTDRGLESAPLFAAVVGLGWQPLMRVKQAGKFRPQGWRKGYAMRGFAPAAGRRWAGTGVAYPAGPGLACTLLACWEAGHEEPWLIVTDLTSGSATALWYAFRTWIEQGFRDLKSDGWKLSKTRMSEPERVARWWAAAALATLWVLEAGAEAQRLGLVGACCAGGWSRDS